MTDKPETWDIFGIIGCSHDATIEQITKSYQKRALQIHPDRNPNDPHAGAKFDRLRKAYEYIKSDDNLAIYKERYQETRAVEAKKKASSAAIQAMNDNLQRQESMAKDLRSNKKQKTKSDQYIESTLHFMEQWKQAQKKTSNNSNIIPSNASHHSHHNTIDLSDDNDNINHMSRASTTSPTTVVPIHAEDAAKLDRAIFLVNGGRSTIPYSTTQTDPIKVLCQSVGLVTKVYPVSVRRITTNPGGMIQGYIILFDNIEHAKRSIQRGHIGQYSAVPSSEYLNHIRLASHHHERHIEQAIRDKQDKRSSSSLSSSSSIDTISKHGQYTLHHDHVTDIELTKQVFTSLSSYNQHNQAEPLLDKTISEQVPTDVVSSLSHTDKQQANNQQNDPLLGSFTSLRSAEMYTDSIISNHILSSNHMGNYYQLICQASGINIPKQHK